MQLFENDRTHHYRNQTANEIYPKSFRLRFFNLEFVQPITIPWAKASFPPLLVFLHLSSLLVHFSRASPCWYATPRRQLTPFDSARLFVIESSAASSRHGCPINHAVKRTGNSLQVNWCPERWRREDISIWFERVSPSFLFIPIYRIDG